MRIILYLLTNLAVVFTVGIIMQVFGLEAWLYQNGIDTPLVGLLVYSALFGFAGSFISLAMSKRIAKWSTKAKVIDQPRNQDEAWLVNSVSQLASRSNIEMPEVAVFPSMSPNAFATGMTKNSSLVAVSEGLLRSMNRTEIEAVLAHEISHVANGDMVTMSLLQGVLNTFVIFLSRVIGTIVDTALRGERGGRGFGYMATVIVLQIAFGIIASIILMAFSRWREFRADAGAASLVGKQPMIDALASLGRGHPGELPKQLAAFGLQSSRGGRFANMFRSHPHIEDRIARLQSL